MMPRYCGCCGCSVGHACVRESCVGTNGELHASVEVVQFLQVPVVQGTVPVVHRLHRLAERSGATFISKT